MSSDATMRPLPRQNTSGNSSPIMSAVRNFIVSIEIMMPPAERCRRLV